MENELQKIYLSIVGKKGGSWTIFKYKNQDLYKVSTIWKTQFERVFDVVFLIDNMKIFEEVYAYENAINKHFLENKDFIDKILLGTDIYGE